MLCASRIGAESIGSTDVVRYASCQCPGRVAAGGIRIERSKMDENASLTSGGCLCGAVRYEVKGPLRDVVNCHCGMCRRSHGNFGPHSKARKVNITITKSDGLAWYKTSDIARRGFCRECGSGLFWEPFDFDATGIIAGSLDAPSGLKTIGHIFVGEKSDFYEIADNLPQYEGSSGGELDDDYQ